MKIFEQRKVYVNKMRKIPLAVNESTHNIVVFALSRLS